MRFHLLVSLLVLTGGVLSSGARAQDLVEWDELARKFITPQGGLDLRAYLADPTSNVTLSQQLTKVAAASVDGLPLESRQAFWVNTHNLFVFTNAVRRPSLVSPNEDPLFFTNTDYSANGARISLQQLMNDKIRAQFNDPMMHFALCAGYRGSPRLLNRAYTVADFPTILPTLATEFLADSRKNRFDPLTGTAIFSELFHWYLPDFGGSAASLVAFVKPFAPASAAAILSRPGLSIQFTINSTLYR